MPSNHIIKLLTTNVKCLKVVEIAMDGTTHEITGDTGQGKSAALLAIKSLVEGLDPEFIREGSSQAEIEIVMTDAQIKRIFPREGASSLKAHKNGKAVKKAADFVRTVCGGATFDPVAFVSLGEDKKGRTEGLRKQRNDLLSALSVFLTKKDVLGAVNDFCLEHDVDPAPHLALLETCSLDEMDFEHSAFAVCQMFEDIVYEKRTVQNAKRDAAESIATVAADASKDGSLAGEVSEDMTRQEVVDRCASESAKATDNYHKAVAQRDARSNLHERRDTLAAQYRALPAHDCGTLEIERDTWEQVRDAKKIETAKLREKLDAAQLAEGEALCKIEEIEAQERQLKNRDAIGKDLAALDGDIKGDTPLYVCESVEHLTAVKDEALKTFEKSKRWKTWVDALDIWNEEMALSDLHDNLVELFRNVIPMELLADSDLDIPGLGIRDEMLTIDGRAMYALGTSEKIKLGVQFYAALYPETGFMLLDRAESLGGKDKVTLVQEAERKGIQVIMTVVDADAVPSEHVTVLRDGEVVEA